MPVMRQIFYSLALLAATATAAPLQFEVTYPKPAAKTPRPVRVYVAMNQTGRPAMSMSNWFNLPNLYAVDDLDGDGKVTITAKADGYPASLDKLKAGTWHVQAVSRLSPNWPFPGKGAGDAVSQVTTIKYDPTAAFAKTTHHIQLTCDKITPPIKTVQSGSTRLRTFRSKLLTQFHERPYDMGYAVLLPDDWDKTKKYPVIVYTMGFSGDYSMTNMVKRELDPRYKNCIVVIPDANCYWGHSVFADSATNGPWGKALTKELLPFIDKEYGGLGPEHRYLIGCSSGGWSSLWLQITYPDKFSGCWAYAPDPICFKHFQEIDIVSGEVTNLYKNVQGKARALCIPLSWGKAITYEAMGRFEKVLAGGGQLASFSGVFSPRLDDGSPALWFDYETGELKPEVIKQWQPYDINKNFPAIWKTHQADLKGKINLLVHQVDAFHLTHAVKAFQKTCESIKSDATFTYLRGTGHHIPRSSTKGMFDTINKRLNAEKAQR